MDTDSEVLAIVFDETDHRVGSATARRLIRDAGGHMSLEAFGSKEDLDRTARTTGCFRRGKAIRDPDSRQVIGWEMEEVPLSEAAAGA